MKKRMRVYQEGVGNYMDVYTRHWADKKTGDEHYEGPSIRLTDTGSGYLYESDDKSLRFNYGEMVELLEILEWQERLRKRGGVPLRDPRALRMYTKVKTCKKK